MNYCTYILKSLLNSQYYIGHTNNIDERLKKHNSGKNISTKPGIPWTLVYKKYFKTRTESYKYEQYLKAKKNRKALEKTINDKG